MGSFRGNWATIYFSIPMCGKDDGEIGVFFILSRLGLINDA